MIPSSPPPQPSPIIPTDLGLARGRREAPPPQPRRPPPPTPSSASAGGGLKDAGTCAVHCRRRISASKSRTSSPPSSAPSTRWRPPATAPLHPLPRMVCVSHPPISLSLSLFCTRSRMNLLILYLELIPQYSIRTLDVILVQKQRRLEPNMTFW